MKTQNCMYISLRIKVGIRQCSLYNHNISKAHTCIDLTRLLMHTYLVWYTPQDKCVSVSLHVFIELGTTWHKLCLKPNVALYINNIVLFVMLSRTKFAFKLTACKGLYKTDELHVCVHLSKYKTLAKKQQNNALNHAVIYCFMQIHINLP